MAYDKSDFVACKYNPLEKDFAAKYPTLMECIPEGYTGNGEQLVKYVCLMYDPASRLIRDTSTMEQRKRMAAMYAGYDLADTSAIESLFELTDEVVVAVIDYFMKHEVRERLWYLIQGNEQTFYEYGKRLMMPVKWDAEAKEKDLLSAISIKTKLSEDMANILERLENDYRKLYADDTNLMKATAKKKFSPEQQASRIK